MKNIIETTNLSIGYKIARGEKRIIHEKLNISLVEGSITSILGVNGVGKSTLIRTLCGFIPSLEGDVKLAGKSLKNYSNDELSSILSVVLTERVSDGGLTVYEIVSLGRYPYTGFFGRLTSRDKEVVEQSLKDIGIWEMRNKYISELSDGERQKVMIAKSLSQESKIIILDEPTSFLDIKSRMEIVSLLRKLAKEKNMTFLLSLHDLELSLQYSDYLWIMNREEGVISGQTEELILSGDINKAVDNSGTLLFNIELGVFRSYNAGTKEIAYEGVDLLWVKNALIRENFTFNQYAKDKIIVSSYDNITTILDGVTKEFSSINELAATIK